jgi:(p)ppGpp synthase/HD superfamily hydrolase
MDLKLNNIYDAIDFATEAHKGQVDKAGQLYIEHCKRVAENIVKMGYYSVVLQIIAYLHDILEDTKYTVLDLQSLECDEESISILQLLQHKNGQSYHTYIDDIAKDRTATIVKIADLEDNMDIRRLEQLDIADLQRLNKYLRAWKQLTKAKESFK